MASLYKRATPSQQKMLRMIEGAVYNWADAHDMERDEFMARGIAKRAAGTLSAQMRDVLAVSPAVISTAPSEGGGSHFGSGLLPKVGQGNSQPKGSNRCKNPASQGTQRQRGASHLSRRTPLTRLWKKLASQMWNLRRTGQLERFEAYKEVLRAIAKLQELEGK
jgi:hypothetical protein